MPEIGQTISHYRILEKIGVGGMGEVYLAEDQSLDRRVALKFLPDIFTGDPERMARFEREAKLLASLNHPNIAAIYGLEQAEGKRFLIMEYVEGETLQARISKGALPLDEALGLCKQVAEGLEAAHEKGVIHRDLKPTNVMITGEEKVKILDFGLAKALLDEGKSVDSSQSPTITEAMTQPGVVLGTAAYMSPEQAKGKAVDKRADIWAFGCILYECLSGKRVFEGETVTETLAAVLKNEPDLQAVPAMTPPRVRLVLRRCLQKDQKLRLRDIADALFDIVESTTMPGVNAAPTRSTHLQWRELAAWILAAVAILAAILLGILHFHQSPSAVADAQPLVRVTVRLPETEPLAFAQWTPLGFGRPSVAISSDGARLVYVAVRNRASQLYLRTLDKFEAVLIPGTQGAYDPFFSPDGTWIGFFAENKLKKISLWGSEPIDICDARNPSGGSWGSDDTILFSDSEGRALYRVPAEGGVPQAISFRNARYARWPELLPDAKAAIITTAKTGSEVAVLFLETGEVRTLVKNASHGRYAQSGHIVFVSGNSLLAAPFDLVRLEVTGSAVPILQGVRTEDSGVGQFSFSQNGSLVYAAGTAQSISELVWVDRQGVASRLELAERAYGTSQVSPDGGRLAITVKGPSSDIWIYDLVRGTQTRLTVEGSNSSPVWSPDGKRVAFTCSNGGISKLFSKAADDSGEAEELYTTDSYLVPTSYSPDGNMLAFYQSNPDGYTDIWILPLDTEHKPRLFLQDQFTKWGANFSPDGKWIAYTSDESGQYEVYVRPYPGLSGKYPISIAGGEEPVWSPNGQELIYRNGQRWMVVPISLNPKFSAGRPRILFEGDYVNTPGPSFDISPDGQRFLMLRPSGETSPDLHLNVVLGWFEELKERVPVD